MAKRGGRQRSAARQREKDRKERAAKKRERRAERAESRAAGGGDPELEGIVPGPQPKEAIDEAEVQRAVERVLRPGAVERPMSPAKAAACRLFVGNLDPQVDAASLRRHFTTSGYDVVDASVVKDRASGRSRGFAFVELKSPEAAREAVTALDGVELDGRALRIRSANDRP